MNNDNLPYASREDWLLRNTLYNNPDCCMMDERGRPAAPWQQNLSRQLQQLEESRRWCAVPFERGGKTGLWDPIGDKVMVPALYEAVGDTPELPLGDTAFTDPVPVRKGRMWGMVSSDGKNRTILPFEYQEISYLDNAFNQILVRQYGKYGLISLYADLPGLSFPCIADSIRFDEDIDRLVFRKDGRLGLVWVTEALFDGFRLFDDETESIVAVRDGRSGFLTLDGEFFEMGSVFLPTDPRRLHHYELSNKEKDMFR